MRRKPGIIRKWFSLNEIQIFSSISLLKRDILPIRRGSHIAELWLNAFHMIQQLKRAMKEKLYKTPDEFEQSSWVKMSSDSQKVTEALNRAPEIIKRMGVNTPGAQKFGKLVELFKDNMGTGKLFSVRNAAILAGVILYWVSPIDFIPDFLPVIGWLDDLGLLAMAVSWIMPEKKPEFESQNVSIEQIDNIVSNLPENQDMEKYKAELSTLRKDLEELRDDELLREVDTIEEVIADPLRRIVVTGTFSAGKSSLINRLLDRDLLPTSPEPCTPVLTTIMHGEKEQALIQRKDGSVEVIADLALLRDHHSKLMENAQELNVQLPHELLRDGLTIVDTCGLDYSQLDERTFDELPHSSLLVFVKSLQIPSMSKEEDEFISGVTGKLLGEQLMVVLNKADLFNEGAETLQKVCGNIRAYFEDKQLNNVQVFATSACDPNHHGVEEIKRELKRRIRDSFQDQSSKEARKLLGSLQNAIHDRREAREELERLSREQKKRVQAALQEKWDRDIAKVEKLADGAKERFATQLRTYVDESLSPHVDALIEKTRMDEKFPSVIMEVVRNGLAQFIKEGVQNLSTYFEGKIPQASLDPETMASLKAPGMGSLNEEAYDNIGKWLLPGTTLLCLLTMGIFSWLTSVALPLLIMDRFDVGGKLMDIVKMFGPTRAARDQFRAELHAGLESVQTEICNKVNKEVIDRFVERYRATCRKNSL